MGRPYLGGHFGKVLWISDLDLEDFVGKFSGMKTSWRLEAAGFP